MHFSKHLPRDLGVFWGHQSGSRNLISIASYDFKVGYRLKITFGSEVEGQK